jgi:hypothetical protein
MNRKIAGSLCSAALIICPLLCPATARAQVGFNVGGRVSREQVQGSGEKPVSVSVVLYPIAVFQQSGRFGSRIAGTRTLRGRLTALDVGYRLPRSRMTVEAGGWYWGRSERGFDFFDANEYVYQLHGRLFFTRTRELGIQAGVLKGGFFKGNNAVSTSTTLFVISEVSSERAQRRTDPTTEGGGDAGAGTPQRGRKPAAWAFQLGLGMYANPENDPGQLSDYTRGFTGFVQGSVALGNNVSLNASVWYLRDRFLDYNRFTLGLGYGF